MKHTKVRPIIGITMGDPLGIGPEILVKTLNNPDIYSLCRPIVLGDPSCIRQAIDLIAAPLNLNCITSIEKCVHAHRTIDLLQISNLKKNYAGMSSPDKQTGKAMENYIIKGIDLALENRISALVTCPITKTAMKLAGSSFHGHTELLADRTGSQDYSMMLAGETLKVVLVTIHIPLNKVSKSLSVKKIIKTIHLTNKGLKTRFGIDQPKIAVAGLNPHAGEDTMFGNEEQSIIIPAVAESLKMGINVSGPLPPDTVFYQAANGKFDAVVCMYHDQGLIPFKLIHFKDGVNTTLGLPIIRTSVDHGTAYDIAWKGIADPTSLEQAVKMASFQAENQISSFNQEK